MEKQGHFERRGRVFALLACIAGVVALEGMPTLGATFLSDDVALISWGRDMLQRDFWDPVIGSAKMGGVIPYYRPLALLSHGMDYALYGWSPAGHHATNLLLHFICAALVFGVAREFFPRDRYAPAALAALLFALHPGHEMTLLWIAARMELLCAAFYLLTVWTFLRQLRHPRQWGGVLPAASCALALMSKEMAYAAPLVCLGLAPFVLDSQAPLKRRAAQGLRAAGPLFVIAGLFFALRLVKYPWDAAAAALQTTPGEFAIVAKLGLRYLLFPFHVSLRELAAQRPLFLAGLAATTLCALGALFRKDLARPLLIAFVWTALSAAPIVKTLSAWSLYIPSVGFCIAAASLLTPRDRRRRIVAVILLVALTAAYGAQWRARQATWLRVDACVRTFFEDYKKYAAETPSSTPIFLTVPGAIADLPVFMHYFPLRMRLEIGDPALTPLALSRVTCPDAPAAQRVAVNSATPGTWRIALDSPNAYLSFPDRMDYRHVQQRLGEAWDEPWGRVETRALNPAGQISVVDARLAPQTANAKTPIYYFSKGRLRRGNLF